MSTLSLKARIYLIIAFFAVLLAVIGGIGVYSMQSIDTAMGTVEQTSEQVAAIGDIRSMMQTVVIDTREIILAADNAAKREKFEALEKFVAETVDPAVAAFAAVTDMPNEYQELTVLWTKHKEIVSRIAAATLAGNDALAMEILNNECNPTRKAEFALVQNIVDGNKHHLASSVAVANATYDQAWKTLAAAGVLGAALGLLLSVRTVSRLNRSLLSAITDITERSADVERISGQIAGASNDQADGAVSQASALEETSSALEQMASMTRQNADNAAQTRATTDRTLGLIAGGSKKVAGVTEAMGEISESAERIHGIIKTIEEIAFQTNLLALNAAVEAARAGEAGLGFAVVADEVRRLAQRSSQAAKDTAELIEKTVIRVKNGAESVDLLAEDFTAIESEAQVVGRLIGEISTATAEQAQGVDQVNMAVAQVDKVTQANASSAEESASASSELSEEAARLNDLVSALALLVHGGNREAPEEAAYENAGETARNRLPVMSDRARRTLKAAGNTMRSALPVSRSAAAVR